MQAKAKKAKPAAELPADGSIPAFLKREPAQEPLAKVVKLSKPAKPPAESKEAKLRAAREQHLADVEKATAVKPAESVTTNAHAKDRAQAFLDQIKRDDEAAKRKAADFKNGKAAKPPKLTKAQKKDKAEGKPVVHKEKARFDWKGAEEAAKKGKLPPKLDFSADTHTRFREKLAEIESLVKEKDVGKLRKCKWPGFESSSPKAMHRWRDLCVTALSAK